MGCCVSQEERANKKKNEDIEKQLEKDRSAFMNEVKILLLGGGESNKSTFLKELKLIYDGGYINDKRESFKKIIFSNLVQSMRVVIEAMNSLGIALGSEANHQYTSLISELPNHIEGDTLPSEIAIAMKNLWADTGVQACFGRKQEHQLNDSAKYYFDSIDRIAAPDYMPDDQDVLQYRLKIKGISESKFHIGDAVHRWIDLGGQPSECKKWIHCLENVTAILFLVSISEYDQFSAENKTVNRLQETLTLFNSICNSRWFVQTPIILVVIDSDRFKEKLLVSPLGKYFPDYKGGESYETAFEYVLQRFQSLNQSEMKPIYTFSSCAGDTFQIKGVMAAISDIIIQNAIRQYAPSLLM